MRKLRISGSVISAVVAISLIGTGSASGLDIYKSSHTRTCDIRGNSVFGKTTTTVAQTTVSAAHECGGAVVSLTWTRPGYGIYQTGETAGARTISQNAPGTITRAEHRAYHVNSYYAPHFYTVP